MAKSSGQKLKLLYLLEYLYRETDEEHPATVKDLIRYLSAKGIRAERKSLYDDVEQLCLFGIDVVKSTARGGGYFIGERIFELSEVKLLVDVVQSSRFLTEKKSTALIRKLQELTGRHQGQALERTVVVSGRVKTMNETIYITVDRLSEAIRRNRQIRFQYFEFAPNGEKRLHRDGERYLVSPYHLIWDDENYYLVCYEHRSGEKRHFRVDKMTSVALVEEEREGSEVFEKIDLALYEKKLFGMFNGVEERVTLLFDEKYYGVFYDRFGKDLVTRRVAGGCECSVSVFLGPVFYSFLSSFGGGVKVVSPAWVREEYCVLLREALEENDKQTAKE